MSDIAYVYKIEHVPSCQKYIGSTTNWIRRQQQHLSLLRRGKHHSHRLQQVWDRDGEQSFVYEIMIVCSKKDLIFYEQKLIDGFSISELFNIRLIAETNYGYRWKDELRLKHSKSKAGDKYGTITLLEFRGVKSNHHQWFVRCDCGKEYVTGIAHFRSGQAKSCGCVRGARQNNGFTSTREYRKWCIIRKSGRFVSQEWRKFANFLKDVGIAPRGTKGILLDEKLGYRPGNFAWVFPGHLRYSGVAKPVKIEGREVSVRCAERIIGLNYGAIFQRARRRSESHQIVADYFYQKKVAAK